MLAALHIGCVGRRAALLTGSGRSRSRRGSDASVVESNLQAAEGPAAEEQGQRGLLKAHNDRIRSGFKKHRERTQGTPPPAKTGANCRAIAGRGNGVVGQRVAGQWGREQSESTNGQRE